MHVHTPNAWETGSPTGSEMAGTSPGGDAADSTKNVITTLRAQMDDAITNALDVARDGAEVFPVAIALNPENPGTLDKRPLVRGGHRSASSDPERITAMFNAVHDAGNGFTPMRRNEVLAVGLVAASVGAVVFDLDRHPGKPDGVQYAQENLKSLPPHTYTQITATGGEHRFYRKRDVSQKITNASPWKKHGIDIRGDDGWVVLAGTSTPWGEWYALPGKPPLTSLALAPKDLWDELVKHQSREKATAANAEEETVEPHEIPEDLRALLEDITVSEDLDRSGRFHRIVCRAKRAGLSQGQATTLAGQWVKGIRYEKYSGRIAEMVALSWSKTDDDGLSPEARQAKEDIQAFIDSALSKNDPDGTTSPAQNPPNDASSPAQNPSDSAPSLGGKYIDGDGLHVADLAGELAKQVPLSRDLGDTIWIYNRGVWKPDDRGFIRTVVTKALGNRSRPAHTNAVEHYLRGQVPVIEPAPNPDIINVLNGHLDWRTGILNPHDPETHSTVQIHANWNQNAECPAIEKWLAQVLPADLLEPGDGTPGFIWEVIGYLVYSGNPLHRAILLLGSGRNGKGTFLRTVTALLGDDNVSSVDIHSLMTNRFRVADLFGKVANIAGDIDGKYLESTAMLKAITGGDKVTAERKFGPPFSFTPFAVPVYSANSVFGTPDTSPGYMARWLVIPFPHEFLGREDRNLDKFLQQPGELSGLLVKAVYGLQALMDRGNFTTPPSVEEAYERFAAASDPVRAFMNDVSTPGDEFVTRKKIWEIDSLWLDDNGQKFRLSRNKLYERLRAAGWTETKQSGIRGYAGRTLTVKTVDGDYPGESRLVPIDEDTF